MSSSNTAPSGKAGVDERATHGQLTISIAGVALRVTADRAIVQRNTRALHGPFLGAPGQAPTVEFPVHLRIGDGPSRIASSRMFDSGSLWSVYEGGGRRRRIVYHDPNLSPTHVWTAELDAESPVAEVFCTTHCLLDHDGQHDIASPVVYPLDQIFCMYALAARRGLILHSCGFETAGRGIVLAGRSGAGKTTNARVLEPRADVTVFSDDRTIVRRYDDGWRVHGTPWPGDARIARNLSAPLSALVFLTKADHNAIEPISTADALRRVLIVASVPWYDAEYMPPVLDTVDRLLADIPCYEFRFRNDPSAADAIVSFAHTLTHTHV